MPTRRQYLGSAVTAGALALAGCTGQADIPDSIQPESSGWNLPQGSVSSTRENPDTEYVTSDFSTVTEVDSSSVGSSIRGTVLDQSGITIFAAESVVQLNWSGDEQWEYTPDGAVLTGGLFDSTVVVVTPNEVFGIRHSDGTESWNVAAEDVATLVDDTEPTFTEYITASETESFGGVQYNISIGTNNPTGLVMVEVDSGSVEDGYVADSTGDIESNPTYDPENGIFTLPLSGSVIGIDEDSFEKEFEISDVGTQNSFAFYGLFITYLDQGTITAVDVTSDQHYESDIESESDSRIQWTLHDEIEHQAPPCRVGTQAVFPTVSGVEAVSLNAGTVTWRAEEVGSCDAVASSKGHVYAVTSPGVLYVVDGHTGDVIAEHLVEGDWTNIAVSGEYIVLTGEDGEVAIVSGSESTQGLDPLVDRIKGGMMSNRLTVTDSNLIPENEISDIDDMPGSDIEGIVNDIIQQYEDGSITYIRARNMLERVVYYISLLDLGISLIQRNNDDRESFTVGDGLALNENSLVLPPEMERDGELDELSNEDVSLSMAYSRRAAKGMLEVIGLIPATRALKAPMMVWNFATSELPNIQQESTERVFDILFESGVGAAREFLDEAVENGDFPEWFVDVYHDWMDEYVEPATVAVEEAGRTKYILPADEFDRAVEGLKEAIAGGIATRYEYGVEIPQSTVAIEYTDLSEQEYEEIQRDDDKELTDEAPDEIRMFTDRYKGYTAADVPRNVTESDLLDNLDRVDSLPGNQTEATASAIAFQRMILGHTQHRLSQAYPLDVVDETSDEIEDLAVNSIGDLVPGDDIVTEAVEENIQFRINAAQGLFELTPLASVANLTHIVSSMLRLQSGMYTIMSTISDQGSHDILFGVHESDPGERTLISMPEGQWIGDERTAFDDYGDLSQDDE